MSTSVKYFHSGMFGAPALTGAAGTLIAILDACLVNGFGSMTASSLTVSGGVATLTTPSTHPFDEQTVVLVSGATPVELNGEKRVLSRGANQITFQAPGVPDGSATGTISVRLAPAGWEKQHASANLGAYRSLDLASTRAVIRVDDTSAQNALVRAYESMSDVNTGVGPCPTVAQAASGYFWPKANAEGGSGRPWIVVADSKTLWIKVGTVSGGSQNIGVVFGAGDFASRKVGDAYAFSIFGPTAATHALTVVGSVDITYGLANSDVMGGTSYGVALRAVSGLPGASTIKKIAESFVAPFSAARPENQYQSGSAGLFSYPNTADNALLLCRYNLVDGSTLRGRLRGALYSPQSVPSASFPALTIIDGQGALAGRKLLTVAGNTPAAAADDGRRVFFDITGPWE